MGVKEKTFSYHCDERTSLRMKVKEKAAHGTLRQHQA
jgi:hypothetical protein